ADEIGGECSKPTIISLRPAVFDRHIAAFDKTGVIQSLSNDSDQECIGRPRTAAQDTDNRKLLLCARRERPRGRRTAEQRDELSPLHHSIISSARERKNYEECIGAKKHLVLGLLTNTGPESNSFATGL